VPTPCSIHYCLYVIRLVVVLACCWLPEACIACFPACQSAGYTVHGECVLSGRLGRTAGMLVTHTTTHCVPCRFAGSCPMLVHSRADRVGGAAPELSSPWAVAVAGWCGVCGGAWWLWVVVRGEWGSCGACTSVVFGCCCLLFQECCMCAMCAPIDATRRVERQTQSFLVAYGQLNPGC
jgi:hypothetical protein